MISKALVVGAYHKKLEEMAGLGIDLSLIAPPSWAGLPLEITQGKGYRIYPSPIVFSGYNHFHAYRSLKPVLRSIKPDIIHIDEEHYSLVTYQAMRAAKSVGAKTVFFTWQNIFKTYPFPFSAIERYVFANADAAIVGNREAGEVLKEKGFNKKTYEIPQFGVDPKIFKKNEAIQLRNKLGLNDNDFVVGYMGRFIEEKGIETLLDAFVKLQVSAKLLLIGSGPYKKILTKRISHLGIANKVIIVDQVPSLEVPHYMNCMDCLVLPSLTKPNWKEQFGRVLIEAMSCEVPVIGSSSGEIPYVIGDAGLIFKEGQSSDLLRQLESLIRDAELRKRICLDGRQRVLDNYTQRRIAEATHAVYKAIMSS